MSVKSWVKAHIGSQRPAGPETLISRYSPESDAPIARDAVQSTGRSWQIRTRGKRSFRLFEVREPHLDGCLITYRARVRAQGVQQRAYLEMWCHVPGEREYFSKGFQSALRGDSGWTTCETRFYLKPGQRPDAIKLNLAFDGPGAVEIRDIQLSAVPLA